MVRRELNFPKAKSEQAQHSFFSTVCPTFRVSAQTTYFILIILLSVPVCNRFRHRYNGLQRFNVLLHKLFDGKTYSEQFVLQNDRINLHVNYQVLFSFAYQLYFTKRQMSIPTYQANMPLRQVQFKVAHAFRMVSAYHV